MEMSKAILVVVALSFLVGGGAGAAVFNDGNAVFEACKGADNPQDGAKYAKWGICFGYITGVADALDGSSSCVPDGVTVTQAVDVVKLWLPERNWDAATMFFCAESITGRRDEFEAACAAYARCVKLGGTLAAAFLVGTSRYIIAGHQFPILSLSAKEIESNFARHATDIKAERIGMVDREIRSGYSGLIFLTGVAR
jgi:hypothetical protein